MRAILISVYPDEAMDGTDFEGFETQLQNKIEEVGYENILDLKFSTSCPEVGDLQHHALIIAK